jgi:hypothetical protein
VQKNIIGFDQGLVSGLGSGIGAGVRERFNSNMNISNEV